MGKLCYSLSQMDVEYCLSWALAPFEDHMVELRLDELIFDADDIKFFMENKGKCEVIATYRLHDPQEVDPLDLTQAEPETDEDELAMAVQLLSRAIMAGADYIDLDLDFPAKERQWLVHLALNYGCKIIVSYHNAYGTESTEALRAIASRCFALGADIAKVVTTAHHSGECGRVLALYDFFPPEQLLAFAMGREGSQSRFDSYDKGAPFMYIAPRRCATTAPGQPLFFDFLPDDQTRCLGDIEPPCSKSMAIRAIIAAALCDGTSTLTNITMCDDIKAAVEVARQMGAGVRYNKKERRMTVTGHHRPGHSLKIKDFDFFVGESALLARMCMALSMLTWSMTFIYGSGTLKGRRIEPVRKPLLRQGINIHSMDGNGAVPFAVSSDFRGGVLDIDGSESSQFISGLLMALPLCSWIDDVVIRVKNPVSQPYIAMTMDMCRRFGIEYDDPSVDGQGRMVYSFKTGQQMRPSDIRIENDWSAAALWLVLGVISGESGVDNLPVNCNQADSYIMDVLEMAGADVEKYSDPEFGDGVVVYHSAFHSLTAAFECDITDCPDLIGPLMLLAMRSEGISRIYGIHRLCNKESNRAATFCEEFVKLGADIRIEGDCMVIKGGFEFMLKGGIASSHGDHRLAMALIAANYISESDIFIDDTDCISKSWPDFPLI